MCDFIKHIVEVPPPGDTYLTNHDAMGGTISPGQLGDVWEAFGSGGSQIIAYKSENMNDYNRIAQQLSPYETGYVYENLAEKWEAVCKIRLPNALRGRYLELDAQWMDRKMQEADEEKEAKRERRKAERNAAKETGSQ